MAVTIKDIAKRAGVSYSTVSRALNDVSAGRSENKQKILELLAVVCGGLIGLEREYKRRPAGFRTHILICLGAAMTTLTSQFLYLNLHYYTDMARLGAQVVAGIGFIGAGAIIVTRRRRVKGLTTAAGLWAGSATSWWEWSASARSKSWRRAAIWTM